VNAKPVGEMRQNHSSPSAAPKFPARLFKMNSGHRTPAQRTSVAMRCDRSSYKRNLFSMNDPGGSSSSSLPHWVSFRPRASRPFTFGLRGFESPPGWKLPASIYEIAPPFTCVTVRGMVSTSCAPLQSGGFQPDGKVVKAACGRTGAPHTHPHPLTAAPFRDPSIVSPSLTAWCVLIWQLRVQPAPVNAKKVYRSRSLASKERHRQRAAPWTRPSPAGDKRGTER